MTPDEEQIILEQLRRHEDLKLKPYRDPKGVLTIGIGINLDEGLTIGECIYLCTNRIRIADRELTNTFPWYALMGGDRKFALVNMCFNLGLPRFKKFKKMIAALKRNDFETAAKEALDSKWAREDVGPNRSGEIAEMIRMGDNAKTSQELKT